MGFSAIQIILVFAWVFIVAIDQFDLLESLYQPIVSGAVIGAILGDLPTGLVVGGTYQLMTIGNMPVGGAQPPNAVIGGVMAVVFAIASGLDMIKNGTLALTVEMGEADDTYTAQEWKINDQKAVIAVRVAK